MAATDSPAGSGTTEPAQGDRPYPKVDVTGAAAGAGVAAGPSFSGLENAVLAYWDSDNTFQASIDARPAGTDGSNEFVFYDGPPFANGLPHYGHLLTGFVKDVVPRYQTMRGRRVERRFGWDTHGLPAEMEAEHQLGITSKREVLALGIDKFNEVCRQSVLRYTHEWQRYVTRQARWVDFEHDYKTLDLTYMESVMWSFKQLWDKGLVYEDFRVLPYCWRCETPLSNHELRMDDDVYRPRQDPAVTVWFELESGERLLAWTTTPWTLPSNLALAVAPDTDYAVFDDAGQRYVLAEARVAAYERELDGATRVGTMRGSELVGRTYRPMFDYLVGTDNAFTVLAADFVTTDEGTGVVHMAPAYGEDDQVACAAAGIPVVLTVDDHATFLPVVTDFAGMQVFDANPAIVAMLRERGQLVRHETYEHSYPHCWRCDTPLIYKALSSWFVQVTRFRDRMVELNQEINWVPGHIKDGQFGKWLANARDWSISRNRFWGNPLPVWRSDNPDYPRVDVYGSLDELERDFGVRPTDLHRPFVDELTRPNPDDPSGDSTMRRVPEVLDVWFDSGSMPFAQVHYPFENASWFEHHFPGDFIVEYTPQTRGWFYTLHVLSTALFDRPAFRNCICHGTVLGDDGLKMSKSTGNFEDVSDTFETYGADAVRWLMMSSSVLRGGNMVVSEDGIRDVVRHTLLPLWNTWYFFALYANSAGDSGYDAGSRVASGDVLDQYLLAKTRDLVTGVAADLDGFDVAAACEKVRVHLDVLTNWYVRRSRSRFWREDQDAFDVLFTCLEQLCRVAAPLLPLTTEAIWRGLTGGRSVHLTDWPDAESLPELPELVQAMDRTREAASAALRLRKSAGLRVRLPLPALTVVTDHADRLAGEYAAILAEEVNVREVRLVELAAAADGGYGVTRRLTVNARAAGPRLGKAVQQAIRGSKSDDWSVSADGVVTSGGVALQDGEYALDLVVGGAAGESTALPGGGFVLLDTAVTPELAAEGLARDVIRAVQNARRDAGLAVSDRIALRLDGSAEVLAAVAAHRDAVLTETLSTSVTEAPVDGPDVVLVDGAVVRIAVERA